MNIQDSFPLGLTDLISLQSKGLLRVLNNTMEPTKVRLVKAMVFSVVMYGCESWTIKLSAEELMLLNCGAREDY